MVVCVGRPGISREVQALLRNVPDLVVVDPHADWADPTRSATRLWRGLPTTGLAGTDPAWLRAWLVADEAAASALGAFLDDSGLSEPRVLRDVLHQLPSGGLCVIGSSMPIRDAEVTMAPRRGVRILCNRGLAGIDGTTSTAVGAALAHQAVGGGPAIAVLGDLTFLHDLSGLVTGVDAPRPDLTLVVLNNGGGGIFSLVSHTADAQGGLDDLFATPQSVDIGQLAAGCGWAHVEVSSPGELASCLRVGGPLIIEVKGDRGANAKLHQRLSEHIGITLDAVRTG